MRTTFKVGGNITKAMLAELHSNNAASRARLTAKAERTKDALKKRIYLLEARVLDMRIPTDKRYRLVMRLDELRETLKQRGKPKPAFTVTAYSAYWRSLRRVKVTGGWREAQAKRKQLMTAFGSQVMAVTFREGRETVAEYINFKGDWRRPRAAGRTQGGR